MSKYPSLITITLGTDKKSITIQRRYRLVDLYYIICLWTSVDAVNDQCLILYYFNIIIKYAYTRSLELFVNGYNKKKNCKFGYMHFYNIIVQYKRDVIFCSHTVNSNTLYYYHTLVFSVTRCIYYLTRTHWWRGNDSGSYTI